MTNGAHARGRSTSVLPHYRARVGSEWTPYGAMLKHAKGQLAVYRPALNIPAAPLPISQPPIAISRPLSPLAYPPPPTLRH